jgi:hypothetical protein
MACELRADVFVLRKKGTTPAIIGRTGVVT